MTTVSRALGSFLGQVLVRTGVADLAGGVRDVVAPRPSPLLGVLETVGVEAVRAFGPKIAAWLSGPSADGGGTAPAPRAFAVPAGCDAGAKDPMACGRATVFRRLKLADDAAAPVEGTTPAEGHGVPCYMHGTYGGHAHAEITEMLGRIAVTNAPGFPARPTTGHSTQQFSEAQVDDYTRRSGDFSLSVIPSLAKEKSFTVTASIGFSASGGIAGSIFVPSEDPKALGARFEQIARALQQDVAPQDAFRAAAAVIAEDPDQAFPKAFPKAP